MIFQRRVGHFKPGFLSSQGSKLDNLSAHKIENLLNFSKLTQLLSVGQFLRLLGAFKTRKPNPQNYFSDLVVSPLNIEEVSQVESMSDHFVNLGTNFMYVGWDLTL